MTEIRWQNPQSTAPVDFTCAYCAREVTASFGWIAQNVDAGQPSDPSFGEQIFYLAICPRCANPTYLRGAHQIPGVPFGEPVEHLPDDVASLYHEARLSTGDGAYTAAVMVGRKLLMNVAVTKGAAVGQRFVEYVDHLANAHVITADMKPWVDEIRKLGNEANHEIAATSKEQAEDLITFLGMLLRVVYEYPARHKAVMAARATQAPPPGTT